MDPYLPYADMTCAYVNSGSEFTVLAIVSVIELSLPLPLQIEMTSYEIQKLEVQTELQTNFSICSKVTSKDFFHSVSYHSLVDWLAYFTQYMYLLI